MAPIQVGKRKEEILGWLRKDHIKTIVLYGEAGVGKTWTAREVSNLARQEGLVDIVLWVYLSRRYGKSTLVDSIAQQLFLLPTPGEFEVDEAEIEDLTKRIQSKLSKKNLLLVLDDEGNKMNEEGILSLLNTELKLNNYDYKLIVTTNFLGDAHYLDSGRSYYLVDHLGREEAMSLFKKRACLDGKFLAIDTLDKVLLQRTQYIPIAIILVAKAYKYFLENGAAVPLTCLLEKSPDSKTYTLIDILRSGYDIIPNSILIDCRRDYKKNPFFSDSRGIHYNDLIVYWMMEGYLGHVSCMEKTFKKGYQIIMELVDFQVLKRVEANYVTINPLQEKFDDFLSQRKIDDYRLGYHTSARLGLDSVFANYNNWNGLLSISRTGSVAGTHYGGKQGEPIYALLHDGNALTEDLASKLMNPLKELQVLGIFNPALDLISSFVSMVHGLHVLVLRSCLYLEQINQLSTKNFENLTVLEISGPSDSSRKKEVSSLSSFKGFPNSFFKRMRKLQSLNLSSFPMVSLPSSLYNLDELKWLVLRDCTSLTFLSSLRNCKNLMVLDCSGCTSLVDIQDQSFLNANLEMINLSETRIQILPLFGNLKKLTHLFLRKCSWVKRLCSISNMTSLEVIDLSNSSDFSHFFDNSFHKLDNLKVLDLSGTGLTTLPGHIGNPRHLCLENCSQLRGEEVLKCLPEVTNLERFVLSDAGIQSLPPISHLTNIRHLSVTRCLDLGAIPDLSSLEKLEELDFSGCKNITSILDKTFDRMFLLQKLNFSGTSIESLPSLANLSNLCCLLLKDCKKLKMFPSLESKFLAKLKEVCISGGKALRNIDAKFLDGAVNLHILDLSHTSLVKLPSFSKLRNLHELYLRNCKDLNSVPDLGNLINLEILDLSGSAVSALPLLSNLIKLRQLLLKNCSSLSLFLGMGTLNVLGDSVQNLPYGISGLTSLERLDLPDMDYVQGADRRDLTENSSGTKPDECEWGISSLSVPIEKGPFVSVSGTQFLQSLEKEPSLWESMLKTFHLCVYPIKELDAKSVLPFCGDDLIYRDIYLQNKHIGESEYQRLLEINGFPDYKLEGIDTVFSHANQFIFADNKYQVQIPAIERNEEENIQLLPSFFTAFNSKQIKGCWIEKRRKVEFVFSEKEIGNILGLLNSVETLWVSNAMSLKSIFEIPFDSELEKEISEDAVFERELTEDGGLKKDITEDVVSEKEITKDGWSGIEISEDDWSEKEITEDGGSEKDIQEDELERLLERPENGRLEIQDKESLFELPEDGGSQKEVPDKKESLFEMPEDEEGLFGLSEDSESEKEVSEDKNKSLFEVPEDDGSEKEVPDDKKESLFEMPEDEKESLLEMPEDDGSEKEVPEEIKESLFEMPEDVFQKLEELYLDCCPKISTVLSLPQLPQKLKVLQIKFCDKLGKVFDQTVENSKLQYLETLHLWELPELKSIGCELPSLKTLRISNCPNLQKLTETIRSADSLQTLWISNVYDLEVIDISQELKYLSIDSCPNLLKISTLSLAPRELEIQIRFCNNLETVFEEGSSSTIKLQKLHLHGLPKMKSIGAILQDQATCFIVDCLDFNINV